MDNAGEREKGGAERSAIKGRRLRRKLTLNAAKLQDTIHRKGQARTSRAPSAGHNIMTALPKLTLCFKKLINVINA